MYKEHFGITHKPFSITPDPDFLYMSDGHREALAHLRFGLEDEGGFVLLTGEVGTGKTTVCRCLLEQVPEDANIAFIFNPKLTSLELLASICDELNIEYATDTSIKVLVDALNSYLIGAHAKGLRTVLIIDEAQTLSVEVLEQIRLLTNLETSRKKLIHVILLGQPELAEKLSRTELRQLDQRISARHHLGPLSMVETKAYVHHRLTVAGMNTKIFSGDSLNKLYDLSAGIPRVINMICDRSLLGAFSKGVFTVDRALLVKAASEVFGKPVKQASVSVLPRRLVAGFTIILCVIALVLISRQDVPHDSGSKKVSSTQIERKAQPAQKGASAGPKEADVSSRKEIAVAIAPLKSDSAPNDGQGSIKRNDEQTVSRIKSTPGDRTAPAQLDSIPKTLAAAKVPETLPIGTVTSSKALSPIQAVDNVLNKQNTTEVSSRQVQPVPVVSKAAIAPPPVKKTDKVEWPTGELAGKSEYLAYENLLRMWGLTGYKPGDEWACEYAEENGLRCLAQQGSIDSVIRLNRPALLRMVNDQHQVFFMVLTSVQGDTATFKLGDREVTISIDDIALNWSGVYVLVWQPPPGYTDSIRPGHKGPEVSWLARKLSEISGEHYDESQGKDVFDSSLVEKVRRFQFANNLVPDGIVGKGTIIFINTLAGKKTPVLQAHSKQ